MNTDIYYEQRDRMNNNRDTVKDGFYSIKKYVETIKCRLKQAC
jgi:acyl-homoserine lactone acylase PvdQ